MKNHIQSALKVPQGEFVKITTDYLENLWDTVEWLDKTTVEDIEYSDGALKITCQGNKNFVINR